MIEREPDKFTVPPNAENEQPEPDEALQLPAARKRLLAIRASAAQRKERCVELLGRPSSMKWNAKKIEKERRRLESADKELAFALDMLDQVERRMRDLGIATE